MIAITRNAAGIVATISANSVPKTKEIAGMMSPAKGCFTFAQIKPSTTQMATKMPKKKKNKSYDLIIKRVFHFIKLYDIICLLDNHARILP